MAVQINPATGMYDPNYDPILEERRRQGAEEIDRIRKEAEGSPSFNHPVMGAIARAALPNHAASAAPTVPAPSRGTQAREEAALAAAAAKERADAKTGGPPAAGTPIQDFPVGDSSPDPMFSAPQKIPQTVEDESKPVPGIRAFRVGGRTVFTNLPGLYEGPARGEGPTARGGGQEIAYEDAVRGVRETVAGQARVGVPAAPGDTEGRERAALVNTAREAAARSATPSSSTIELSPGGLDKFGNELATPRYFENLGQTFRENNQILAQGAARESLALTPQDRAELDAYVNRSKNHTLGTLQWASEKQEKLAANIVELEAQLAKEVDPTRKEILLKGIKELQARKDAVLNVLAFTNRQQYFGGAAIGAGSGDTTPGQ